MNRIKWVGPIMTVTLAVGLGFYFGNRLETESRFIPIVKTYQIAPERVVEAKSALQHLFSGVDTATAESMGVGLLSVRMPQSFEKGVDEMIAKYLQVSDVQNRKLKMDYWLVRGFQNSKTQSVSKELGPIDEAIDSIQSVDGKMSFELLEHLNSQMEMGTSVKVKGMVSEVKSSSSYSDGKIGLFLRYVTKFGEIETNIKMKEDQFLVVGQNAVKTRDVHLHAKGFQFEESKHMKGTDRVYYIVRGQLIE